MLTRNSRFVCSFAAAAGLAAILGSTVLAGARAPQPQASPDFASSVGTIATEVLAATGVPSASIAIVRDGRIAYLKAYGDARLEPKQPASPEMRYSIGSISKQFTAAAVLLLQQENKLSLDDKVAKYLPALTRAGDVTIRQLLSHTSGYQDYWPQDYVPPFMLQPVSADRIMEMWAKKALDFEPGARWQYSNTNFVIAGAIVEKVGGKGLMDVLRERIFAPLGMQSVLDIDQSRLTESDPTGYIRYALGPLRPAPKEGKGWLFAAGELAMTAEDLAKWDLSVIGQTVLSPASYRRFETEILTNDGVGTHYGLGVDVAASGGHRSLAHGGEVSGFTAQNVIFPDDRAAIVVLTNQDAASAAAAIARRIQPLLLAAVDPGTADATARARKIFEGLQAGAIDRTLFTTNANAYFSEQALADFAASLKPLGAPRTFEETGTSLRGGMRLRSYRVACGQKMLRVWTYELPDGKLEQYQVAAQ